MLFYCSVHSQVQQHHYSRNSKILSLKLPELFEIVSTLQMFTGVYGVFIGFPCNIYEKRAVRIAEKPYTPQRERLCMLWGNPVIFTDCGEILQLSQGFPCRQKCHIYCGKIFLEFWPQCSSSSVFITLLLIQLATS